MGRLAVDGRMSFRRAASIIAKRADRTALAARTMTDHVTARAALPGPVHADIVLDRLFRRSTRLAIPANRILTMTSMWSCERDDCDRKATLYGGGCRRCSLHLCPDHHWDVEVHPCVDIDEEVKDETFATTEDAHVSDAHDAQTAR